MGRKSSVSRLEPAARKHLEKLLREDRLTLNELLAEMREKFPDADVSRSGIHRYKASFGELVGRMREIQTAAGAMVDELGDGFGDKAGALLAQAVTTLATDAALNAQVSGASVKEVTQLARAAKDALHTRTLSAKEREAAAVAACRKLLAEQQANPEKIAKAQGLGPEQLDFWIKDFLGVR